MTRAETATPESQQIPAKIHDSNPAEYDDEYADDDADDQHQYCHTLRAVSRHNSAGFIANVVLLLGYVFAVWFQVYDFTSRAREPFAILLYFIAFALLISSGVIEFSIDVFSKRTVGHGRYHSDSANWNRVISGLFISAGILDIVAFMFWMQKKMDMEDLVLLVSSYFLLVMAVLAMYFQMDEIGSQAWEDTIRSDKGDFMTNALVLVICGVGVALNHMKYSGEDYGDLTDQMEMTLVPLWLLTSLLYVTADVIRLKQGVLD